MSEKTLPPAMLQSLDIMAAGKAEITSVGDSTALLLLITWKARPVLLPIGVAQRLQKPQNFHHFLIRNAAKARGSKLGRCKATG